CNHRIGVGMLVQQELDRLSALGLPVEIRGQRPRDRGCEGGIGGNPRNSELGGTIEQIAPADAFVGVGVEQILFAIEHALISLFCAYFRPFIFLVSPDVSSGLSDASAEAVASSMISPCSMPLRNTPRSAITLGSPP